MKKERINEPKLRKTIASIYSKFPPDKTPKKAYQEFVDVFPETIAYSVWLSIYAVGREIDQICNDILNKFNDSKKPKEKKQTQKKIPRKLEPFVPLKFNKDELRKIYLQTYPALKHDSKKLQLLLYRAELLCRNPLFIRDWEDFNKASYHVRTGSMSWDDHEKIALNFLNKWNTDPYNGIYYLQDEPDKIVAVLYLKSSDDRKAFLIPTLDMRIDLRYSKRRIMDAVRSLVDYHHNLTHKFGNFTCREVLLNKYGIDLSLCKLSGNIPSDLKEYQNCLKVWSMKKESNMSWSQIVKELKGDNDKVNVQTVRNWYNSACKLIKKGVPGFLPFPPK